MGKNQAYKAMQRAKLSGNSAGQEDAEDGMVDGSFHSPEWHAARLASLKTSHTITWEEYKKKQKEDEMKKGEQEADKDRLMKEYRAQLDAERAIKLSKGRNHSNNKSSDSRKKDKDKNSRKHSKKRKRSRRSSVSSSSSESSSSDEDEKESRKSKSRSKRKEKRKHRSRSKLSSSSDEEEEEAGGPLPLSSFFGSRAKT